jgi:hypothetical protein
MNLLAVDPSIRNAGWAEYSNGRLTSCGLWRTKTPWPRCLVELSELAGAFAAQTAPHVLVVEWPQVYGGKRNHHDLLKLAASVGVVAGTFVLPKLELVEPRIWKGRTEKSLHARHAVGVLSAKERAVLSACGAPPSLMHNVIDAVALGLWALRVKR